MVRFDSIFISGVRMKPLISRLILLTIAFQVAHAQDPVDPSTLTNKLVCGYQGWFRCPGDGSPINKWQHWSRNNSYIGPGTYTVDMWPDLSDFDPDELFLTPDVTLTNGQTGYLFSSATRKTVMRHFKWMRDAGIDGVFLQRFTHGLDNPDIFASKNIVLGNVSAGANIHGRVFALEYDTSGDSEATLYNHLVNDWQYLVDTLQITSDPRYLHHEGKPLVIIWGLGFNSDSRVFSPALAHQILDFFQNDPVYGGNYCIGGVPTGWRTLTSDSRTDPEWANVYRRWDALCPWTVGRYSNPSGVTTHKNNYWNPDFGETQSLGIEYLPVVWPGFSWDNLKQLPPGTSLKPRLDGEFIWSQIHAVQEVGVDMTFVAMFDEVDEGTAIFKVSDDHPVTDHWVTYEGMPHDWYMRLAGSAGRMLRGEIPLTSTIPIDPGCNGDEVFFNLGEDTADRMTHPQPADGTTTVTNIGGVTCRKNVDTGTDKYMYFAVDDNFVYQGSQTELCVTIDYYDTGFGSLRLQYDATDAAYKNGAGTGLSWANTWKRQIYKVTDAYFGNRQNGGSDFRINKTLGGSFYIDRVIVSSTIPRPPQIHLDTTQFNHTVTAGSILPGDQFKMINVGVAPLNFTVTDDANWLSVDPATGRNTGEQDTFDIVYQIQSLDPGDYTANISVEDPNADNSPQTITVNLHIDAPITIPGDFDADGDVDNADFLIFRGCISGPGIPQPDPDCQNPDFDGDNDVDQADFGIFQRCLGGNGQQPNC